MINKKYIQTKPPTKFSWRFLFYLSRLSNIGTNLKSPNS